MGEGGRVGGTSVLASGGEVCEALRMDIITLTLIPLDGTFTLNDSRTLMLYIHALEGAIRSDD